MLAKVYIAECLLGKGLFATWDLQAGEEIFACTGKIISLREAVMKGEQSANPIQMSKTTYMDVGAPAVSINHSCLPNAGLVDNIHMVALQNIRSHEEVCFDYSTSMSEGLWTMQCRCGSPVCRGEIRDFKCLPLALQIRYLALGIVQDFIVEECRQELPPEVWAQIEELQPSMRVRHPRIAHAA